MKNLIKKLILLLCVSLLPAAAGNPSGKRWEQDTVFYQTNSLPIPYDPSNLQLKKVPELKLEPGCSGCITINYIDREGSVPARSFVWTSGSKIQSCQIDVFNNYLQFADPLVAYKNFIDHEMIHCLGALHTNTFTGFKFSPFNQPLMASTGRTISPGLSFDDKNVLWEIYDAKITKAKTNQIISSKQFNNIFLVNETQKKYSLSKYGGINTTFFRNVLPGKYQIAVRTSDSDSVKVRKLANGEEQIIWDECFTEPQYQYKTLPLKWVCQMQGKGFALCDEPVTIWINKNKKIRL